MRIVEKIGGIVSIILGILFLLPLVTTAWLSRPVPSSPESPGTLPSGGFQHRDVMVSIGSLTFSGWQMWALLGAIAAAGIAMVIFGAHILMQRKTNH